MLEGESVRLRSKREEVRGKYWFLPYYESFLKEILENLRLIEKKAVDLHIRNYGFKYTDC